MQKKEFFFRAFWKLAVIRMEKKMLWHLVIPKICRKIAEKIPPKIVDFGPILVTRFGHWSVPPLCSPVPELNRDPAPPPCPRAHFPSNVWVFWQGVSKIWQDVFNSAAGDNHPKKVPKPDFGPIMGTPILSPKASFPFAVGWIGYGGRGSDPPVHLRSELHRGGGGLLFCAAFLFSSPFIAGFAPPQNVSSVDHDPKFRLKENRLDAKQKQNSYTNSQGWQFAHSEQK